MINEIDILHERQCCDFTSHAGKEAAGLFCIVSYHHQIVVELWKYCFDSFTEPPVFPSRRMPVFLIQPIWNFKRDVGKLKEVLLNLGTEVTFIPKHHTVMVFPSHIIKIMDIVYACRCHVIRMYDTPYSADSMEFIAIIVRTLRGTISPIGRSFNIITPHGAAFRPDVPADFHRFGVYAEHIFGTIYGNSHLLADFLGKPRRQLTSGVELPSADQIWQIVLTVVVQTMKSRFSLSNPNASAVIAKATTSRSENLGTTPQRRTFPCSFTRFRRNPCRFRGFWRNLLWSCA